MKRLLIVAVTFLFGMSGLAHAADRKMTDAESDALARAMVEVEQPLALKLPGFGFDGGPPNPKSPHIEFFQAWSSVGQGTLGSYMLDLYTGDGWDPITCTEITSPKLEKLRHEIREEMGLSYQRYLQIRIARPPC